MKVTLFTKEGCELCAEAEVALRRLKKKLRFEIDLRYIEDDRGLLELYQDRVPVVMVGADEVPSIPLDERRLEELVASRSSATQ